MRFLVDLVRLLVGAEVEALVAGAPAEEALEVMELAAIASGREQASSRAPSRLTELLGRGSGFASCHGRI